MSEFAFPVVPEELCPENLGRTEIRLGSPHFSVQWICDSWISAGKNFLSAEELLTTLESMEITPEPQEKALGKP